VKQSTFDDLDVAVELLGSLWRIHECPHGVHHRVAKLNQPIEIISELGIRLVSERFV
jgi:hypothetical protein